MGIIIPPGVTHFSENPYGVPAHRHCIHFDWYGFQLKPEKIFIFLKDNKKLARKSNSGHPIFFTLSASFLPLMKKLQDLLRNKPHEVISIRYAFGELLARIVAEKSADSEWDASAWRHMSIMSELKFYIDNNYADDIGYNDFCLITQKSSAYICSHFKKIMGIAPTAYLIVIRILHAKHLLKNTLLPIDEICVRVGIPNHNYFSRLFRKKNNISPSEYRNQKNLNQ
ncbi:MAG: helix-turn-helix transcriptional regulator [Victivallaceae bacterium]|nr:helix-turn-helix transcriptional regulator [Victivallaceae bacterium]